MNQRCRGSQPRSSGSSERSSPGAASRPPNGGTPGDPDGATDGAPAAGGAAAGSGPSGVVVEPRAPVPGAAGGAEGTRVQELSDMTSFPRGVAHPAVSSSGRGASLPDDGFGLSGDTGSLPRAGDRKPPYGPPA